MNVPVALFHGGNDWLIVPPEITKLQQQTKNLVYMKQIQEWDHLDFMWAMNGPSQCYDDIITLFRNSWSQKILFVLNRLNIVMISLSYLLNLPYVTTPKSVIKWVSCQQPAVTATLDIFTRRWRRRGNHTTSFYFRKKAETQPSWK